jgi:hypothetical protein
MALMCTSTALMWRGKCGLSHRKCFALDVKFLGRRCPRANELVETDRRDGSAHMNIQISDTS